MKNLPGFSLIELLIALTLITIISAFAFPRLTDLWQRSTAAILHDELVRAISLAHTTAFARGANTQLCGSNDMKVCANNWDNGFIIVAQDQVIFVYQNYFSPGKLHGRLFPKNHHSLDFSPRASLLFENGTFWYCAKSRENPLWAFAINKIARVKNILPDKKGKILDDKGHLLPC